MPYLLWDGETKISEEDGNRRTELESMRGYGMVYRKAMMNDGTGCATKESDLRNNN